MKTLAFVTALSLISGVAMAADAPAAAPVPVAKPAAAPAAPAAPAKKDDKAPAAPAPAPAAEKK